MLKRFCNKLMNEPKTIPSSLWYHLKRQKSQISKKFREHGLFGIYDHLVQLITNKEPIIDSYQNKGELIKKTFDGFEMLLNPFDYGVSTSLLTYGSREEISAEVLQEYLSKLKKQLPGKINVLEAGANIGHYILTEKVILGDKGYFLAIEPSPDNVELMKKNIELNNYSEHVEIDQVALGPETKKATLNLSERSNLHFLDNIDSIQHSYEIKDQIEVQCYHPMDYLEEKGLSPEEIHVIRMDVQGQEYELLKGLEKVVRAPGPRLIFIETHLSVKQNELDWILSLFEDSNYDIVSVASESYSRYNKNSFSELKNWNQRSYELIVQKNIN